MRVDRTIEPGRYALHPDGGWHRFTDRAELDFKPVSVVTVKPHEPVVVDAPVMLKVDVAPEPMAQLAAFGEVVGGPIGGAMSDAAPPFKLGISSAPGSAASAPPPRRCKSHGSTPLQTLLLASGAIADGVAEMRSRKAAQSRRSQIDPVRDAQATRTAAPGDVFRAIADEFGILPAVGASISCARFKPLVTRDDDADAARAYERAIEERQGRK